MRSRRLSFVAGWAAVALLAAVGFAAFGADDVTPEELQAEAAAASIGHTAGAYAGISFALLGNDGDGAVVAAVAAEPVESEQTEDTGDGTTVAGDEGSQTSVETPTSGWLSEVEVRTYVKAYFEPTDVNKAIRIAWCESRFDPNAKDLRTGGIGLFNHLPKYWETRAENAGFPGADPTDPEASTAAAAWEVYHGAGWSIFSCR
ncbi:MAG TPA: hypothetical protein VEB69_04025 [Acidimicrobiia bacterium]|nr:hypothetical protein [Acidimicrobiia bacterium]